jgi:U3 small nucleolar RNA-associated protein 13
MAPKLALKRKYEKTASIEPFFTGGAISIFHDGSAMACTCGGDVKVVNLKTGAVSLTIHADADQLTALAVSPNGQEVITAGRDFLVKTWQVSDGEKLRFWRVGQGTSYVQRICYDQTATLAAGGCSDHIVRVWDAGRGYTTHNLHGHRAIITSVLFGPVPKGEPNNVLLYSGAEDGEIRVWALVSKTCKAVLKTHDSAVTALAIHYPSCTLLSGGRDRIVSSWDLNKMKLVSSVPIFDVVEGLVIVSPNPMSAEAKSEGDEGKRQKKKKKPASEEIVLTEYKDIEFVTAGEKGILQRWKMQGGRCIAR